MSLETIRTLLWAGVATGAIIAAVCGFFVNIVGQRINVRESAAKQSTSAVGSLPSVAIRYSGENHTLSIKNASKFPLKEVKVFSTAYTFGLLNSGKNLLGRNSASGPIKECPIINPEEELLIDEQSLLLVNFPDDPNYNKIWALTVTFVRDIDGKKFVHVEPYFASRLESKTELLVILLRQSASSGVHGAQLLTSLEEIEKSESYYHGTATK